jgi:uridine kinase
VLIVDPVFAFRPEYNDWRQYRIWLDVGTDLALRRRISRDCPREGIEEATRLHRDRCHVAERIYLAEVGPQAAADAIIDNGDFAHARPGLP